MNRNFFRFSTVSFLILSAITWSCTKIDTTTLGQDLIPVVDNVNTFADTLTINGTQGLFNDSTKIGRRDNHILGTISNDPVFGTTTADIYLQLKPGFFPYYFGAFTDTIDSDIRTGFDEVYLCLSVKGFYGDSTKPQRLKVYTLNAANASFNDTASFVKNRPDVVEGGLIGQTTFIPTDLKNYNYFISNNKRDSTNYQIRILLDQSYLNNLVSNRDTSVNGVGNNIFRSDSIFKLFNKGFVVKSDGTQSNGLCYINLNDINTRLEFKIRSRNASKIDTTYTAFFSTNGAGFKVTPSASANYVRRDRTASEYPNNPQADALYIQTAPGSFANLFIPGLSTLNNRIIHRAEIFVEQIPSLNPTVDAIDSVLGPPAYLYLDLIDTASANQYKPVYFDLNPSSQYNPDNLINTFGFFQSVGIDFNYFGGFLRKRVDNLTGKTINYYTFNLSRYVQSIVTNGGRNYGLRLYAPYDIYYYGYTFPFKNNLGAGRIKIGNGNNANYKLRMRIVYSKI